MINIGTLKQMNTPKKIALTKHTNQRLAEREIVVADIVNCIETGEIIKQYEDDKPLSGWLILGKSVQDRYIHIVASHDDFTYLITAYHPAS